MGFTITISEVEDDIITQLQRVIYPESEPLHTTDTEPDHMPAMDPMIEALSALEPETAAESDQVCEPVPMTIPERLLLELDCLEWLIDLSDTEPVLVLVFTLEQTPSLPIPSKCLDTLFRYSV